MAAQPRRFLVAIDLNKNQLLNAVVQNLAAEPADGVKGQIYFNTGNNILYGHNGTGWINLMDTGGGEGYAHPTFIEQDRTLSGATVLASFGTTPEGHVDTFTTRTLTLDDLGYTPYSHDTFTGNDLGAALTGAAVISDVEVNAEGHVTGFVTRDLTAADIGAAVINDAVINNSETWSSQKIQEEIAAAGSGGMNFKGNYDASLNSPNLDATPEAGTIMKGDTYVVSTAGTFYTEDVSVGDALIAKVEDPASLADWVRVEKNIQDITDATETTKGLMRFATDDEIANGDAVAAAVKPDQLASAVATKVDDATATVKRKYVAVINDTTSDTTSVVVTWRGKERTLVVNDILLLHVPDVVSGDNWAINYGITESNPDGRGYTHFKNIDFFDPTLNTRVLTITDTSQSITTTTLNAWLSNNTDPYESLDALQVFKTHVESVTGSAVDNTDPLNPVIDIPETNKAAANIGDGTATSFLIAHNFNTEDVFVSVRDNSTKRVVECEITHTSVNEVTLAFNQAPTVDQFRVVVIG